MRNRVILIALLILSLLFVVYMLDRSESSGFKENAPVALAQDKNEVLDEPSLLSSSSEENSSLSAPLADHMNDLSRMDAASSRSLELKLAVKKIAGDEGWSDGFYDLLDVDIERDDAVYVAKQYMNDPNPEKRLLASDVLLRLGEREGVSEALVGLMLLNEGGILSNDSPIQTRSLRLVSQYRLTEALPMIRDMLVDSNNKHKAFSALIALGDRALIPEVIDHAKKYGGQQKNLGLLRSNESKEYLEASFNKSKPGSRKKIVSAWAMLRIGETEPYLSYLKREAREAIDLVPRIQGSSVRNDSAVAFEYLASLDVVGIQEILESALGSKNRSIVDESVTNLILRFKSEKAMKFLIDSMDNKDSILSHDLKNRLLPFLKDSRFKHEITTPVRGDNTEFEWKYSVHQKDWSIYNWVHDYTIDYWHHEVHNKHTD